MYISEHEVRAALTYEALIPAIRQALIDYSAGKVEQPARTILRAGNAEGHRNGWFAVMPVIHGDVMGVKTVTFYPGNAELGLHTHMATVELLNRATGEPLAVMDGRLITEMRTAAVSAVAFGALAPLHFGSPPQSFGIIGSGIQARAHIRALGQVWPEMREIRIWSPTRGHAEKLARRDGRAGGGDRGGSGCRRGADSNGSRGAGATGEMAFGERPGAGGGSYRRDHAGIG